MPKRLDEVAARSLGIGIDYIRLTMLLLSAAYGGAAGALFAHANRIVSPEALEFKTMVLCLTMAVVEGPINALKAGQDDPDLLRVNAYALHLLHQLGVEDVYCPAGTLTYG